MKNWVKWQSYSFLMSSGGILFLLLFAGGCQSEVTEDEGNVIEGRFTGVNGLDAQIELKKWLPGAQGQTGKFSLVESTYADSVGNFRLEPQESLPMDMYQIMVNKVQPMAVIMDSTIHLRIEAALPDAGFIANATITGFQAAQEISEYYSRAMPMQMRQMMLRTSMQQNKDPQKRQQLSDESVKLQSEITAWAKSFIEDHPHSLARLGPLEHLSIKSNMALFQEVLESTESVLAGGAYHQVLKNVIGAQETKTRDMNKSRTVPSGNGANKARSKKNARFDIGDEAPEIVMNDPLGNERKLSDLRGKVVLLDFWASWCGPCRRENPAVVRAYQEYQPKGFEVFSVSLDKDLNRWTAAIQQDQLEWPNHVCDLKGWSNAAARAYGVSSIPHAILIDQDGVIVATHLRGRALVAQLEELLP